MYNTDLPNRAELPSSRQLLRSTAVALAIAGALLTTAVLPSEYGIDPTGIGKVLGLTQMGQIKMSLAAENAKAAPVASAPAPAVDAPARPLVAPVAVAAGVATDAANSTVTAATPPPALPVTELKHEMTITLKPGEAAEIKLDMRKGATVAFTWQASGVVNFDTHGDPPNAPKDFYHGYGKGRGVAGDKGTLQAAFDGKHVSG